MKAELALLAEADKLASIHHPNVVTCLGVVLSHELMSDIAAASGAAARSIASITSSSSLGNPMQHPWVPAIVTEYMPAGSLQRVILSSSPSWLDSAIAKVRVLHDLAVVSLGLAGLVA